MKNFLYYATITLSLGTILFGHFHYQGKLNSVIADSNAQNEALSALGEEDLTEESEDEKSSGEDQLKLGGILEELVKAKKNEEGISLTVLGASALSSVKDTETWPRLLVADLQPLLPDQELILHIVDVDQATSDQIIAEKYLNPVSASEPDLLLIEPFMYNDYENNVSVEDAVVQLEKILKKLGKDLPDAKIILLPANPIPGEADYSAYVSDLSEFNTEMDYHYADHWKTWPTTDNSDLESYIKNNLPTKKGHQLLREFMRGYLLR